MLLRGQRPQSASRSNPSGLLLAATGAAFVLTLVLAVWWKNYNAQDERLLPSGDPPGDSVAATRLPVMELEISPQDRDRLDDARPPRWIARNFGAFSGVFGQDWPYVPARFKYEGKTYDVEVKYRGWNYDHFLLAKKSWRVRFKNPGFFHGHREFNLIAQRVPSVVWDVMQSELLREAGFLVPDQYLVHVRINGRYAGVQTFVEQPDKYFLTRHNREVGDTYGEQYPFHRLESFLNPLTWQQYSKSDWAGPVWSLNRLFELIKNKRSADFGARASRVLDVEQYLTYAADATITSKINPSSHNNRWLYDPILDRFQILPWYQQGYNHVRVPGWENQDRIQPLGYVFNDVLDGLFRVPEYFERYLEKVWELMHTTHAADRMLAKLDLFVEEARADIEADAHKIGTSTPVRYLSNVEWANAVEDIRQVIRARDRYLKSALRGIRMSASMSPGKRSPDGNGTSFVSTLALDVSGFAGVRLEGLDLRTASGRPAGTVRVLRRVPDGSWQPLEGSAVDLQANRVRVREARTLMTQKRFEAWDGGLLLPQGIFVHDNPKPRYGFAVEPLKTRFEYRIESDEPLRLVRVRGRNAVTVSSRMFVEPPPAQGPRNPENYDSLHSPEGAGFLSGKALRGFSTAEVRWEAGVHRIEKDLNYGPGSRLVIEPGAVMEVGPGVSIVVEGQVVARGTPQNPIVFRRAQADAPWGMIGIWGFGAPPSVFEYCRLDGGTGGRVGGANMTGMLSMLGGKLKMKKCLVTHGGFDDGVNTKMTHVDFRDNVFLGNNGDQLDVDFGSGVVLRNRFSSEGGDAITGVPPINGGDGLDLSHSKLMIAGNRIDQSHDKGISAGERSRLWIVGNRITNCATGIAVKDGARAVIRKARITECNTGLNLYQKKPFFAMPSAVVDQSFIFGNGKDFESQPGTELRVRES